jgi:putative pyoverdin transport system ATP-binding/permease protein
MRILRAVVQEIPENLKSLLLMNILSATAATIFVGLVSAAVQAAAARLISARLLVLFTITVLFFHVTHLYSLVTASQDTERLIHRLRIRLFGLVRRTDLVTVEKIGHAALQAALTQDTQILAQVLPMLVLGFQQAMMLLFLAFYLAWLSPLACALAFGLAGLAIAVRFKRVKGLRTFMQLAAAAEGRVFNGLSDLLCGFKEVRMSVPRAGGVTGAIAEASRESRMANTLLKAQWGWNFAVLESMLYALIGLMVFVVPLLVAGYHEVILPTTLAVMFISGPVYTISLVAPFVTQAEMALENIEKMQERLGAAAAAASAETVGTLGKDPASISLDGAVLSYRDETMRPLFKVGPVTAEFRAGQITFITGGNGAGKSTLLRMLTGLIPLDAGHLLADGTPLEAGQMQDYRDRISAIFSDYHLSRRLYCAADPDPVRVRSLLERLGMGHKVAVRDGAFSTIDLSTGQRKRLAFVVAELDDKPVVVLDEWAADQDPHFRRIFYEELLPDLRARGKIVICVTHDDRWFHVADHIYWMNEGRIEAAREA